jgi:hypothetical protein
MNDTTVQEHRSKDAIARDKLLRMLRSTARKYPQGRLWSTRGGFGVSLGETEWLKLSYSGRWTPQDMRDLLALFVVWLVVDPQRLLGGGSPLAGVSREVQMENAPSNGRQD